MAGTDLPPVDGTDLPTVTGIVADTGCDVDSATEADEVDDGGRIDVWRSGGLS